MLMDRLTCSLLVIDVQEKLCPVMDDPRGVIFNCGRLLRGAQLLNVPVSVSEQSPARIGPTLSDLRPYLDSHMMIEKISFSCTREPTFAARMAHLDRPQVVVCGVEAHVCVLQTCIELKAEGYTVFVVKDACSSRQRSDQDAAMRRLDTAGVFVVTTEMVLFEWLGRADDPQFKPILAQLLK